MHQDARLGPGFLVLFAKSKKNTGPSSPGAHSVTGNPECSFGHSGWTDFTDAQTWSDGLASHLHHPRDFWRNAKSTKAFQILQTSCFVSLLGGCNSQKEKKIWVLIHGCPLIPQRTGHRTDPSTEGHQSLTWGVQGVPRPEVHPALRGQNLDPT